MILHFDVQRECSIQAVEKAMLGDRKLMVVTQRDARTETPQMEELYSIGTIVTVRQVSKMQGSIVRVLAEGMVRARLKELDTVEEKGRPYFEAEVSVCGDDDAQASDAPETVPGSQASDASETAPGPEAPSAPETAPEITPDSADHELEQEACISHIKELMGQYALFHPKVGKAIGFRLEMMNDIGKIVDAAIMNMPLAITEKQRVLEAVDVWERYRIAADLIYREVEIAKIKVKLTEGVKQRVDKNQREYVLREQLGYIREELGDDRTFSDAEQFEEAVEKLKAKKEVKERIRKEISRFQSVSTSSSESAVERGYIETLLELPWDKMSKDNKDIDHAERILDRDHFGLEKVKERILEFLAVRCMTHRSDSTILCLVGPPGTGKTSIARSVAEALNKKYVRICLGGVRDEAEIRGHRKTYVGAMPGRIINGLRQAGVKNPLILLDEIDKVSSDYKGDTSSALLEVLDSEQNANFRDHYIEIPVDLSEVFFIATANTTETIPRPLLDRMELIEVTSYTANEKFHIAKEHLLKKQFEKNGMTDGMLTISDGALKEIIRGYTREAGVRDLERKIGEICRKAARGLIQSKKKSVHVRTANLEKYLGKVKYHPDKRNETNEIGIVRGLAWTSVGGDTLQIEVNKMPGKGEIELTGQLGDVMKESAMAGISYIRSVGKQYHIAADCFKKHDFHIHIPEGAVPKDGPSAGITMAAAMLSAITEIPVRADVAMTGEITLRGRVLPIGGLKEKLLAAKTAGIQMVLVPKENQKDVEEISKEITDGLEIVYVETMDEVIERAFVKEKEA
ncbi:MAG: endopeptidase La [Clostridium sp.]|nr:endopeptidase La [Clostridium sp.]